MTIPSRSTRPTGASNSSGNSFGAFATIYDSQYADYPAIEGDVGFLTTEAAESRQDQQRVVDLGCGTGRLALAMTLAGFRVVGVDISQEMLREAARKRRHLSDTSQRSRLHLVQGDIRRLPFGRAFSFAYMGFRTFMLLPTPRDQELALESVHSVMEEGGSLVVTLSMRRPHDRSNREGPFVVDGFSYARDFDDARTGDQIYEYEKITRTRDPDVLVFDLQHIRVHPDGATSWDPLRKMTVRYTTEHQLREVADATGFSVERSYGGYRYEDFEAGSRELVCILRAE